MTTEDTLRSNLEKLETALATPIVAGEVVDWVTTVKAEWVELSTELQHQLSDVHVRQFKEMSQVDPEMLACVEKLQAEDTGIEEDREDFDRHLHRIAEQAPSFARDQLKIESLLAELVEDGLALVQRIRKQEVALQTWFVEAFSRDRGVAD